MPPGFSLRAALLVATGGLLGALLRWIAGAYLTRDPPRGTPAVNLAGSFAMVEKANTRALPSTSS